MSNNFFSISPTQGSVVSSTNSSDGVSTEVDPAERETFITNLSSRLNVPRSVAEQLVLLLSPEQIREFNALCQPGVVLSKEEFMKRWGLTEEQADVFFNGKSNLSVASNPYGDALLQFVMLGYLLGAEAKKALIFAANNRKNIATDAAQLQFTGELFRFIFTAVAGAVTAGMGVGYLRQSQLMPNDKGFTGQHVNPWLGPMGVGQITPIFTGSGDLANASFQRDAAVITAEKDYMDRMLDQFWELYQRAQQFQDIR